MINKPHTLVIFDIDGTLLYSNKIDSQCFADAYESIYQKPFPTIDWSQYPAVTDTVIFETVIKEQFSLIPDEDEVNIFRDAFVDLINQKRKANPADFRKVPGAQSAVHRLLADDQFAVGIGTGGWQKPATVKLKHVGIEYSDIFMSCADGRYTREAIVQGSISPALQKFPSIQRIVYVGDALWDVRTTRNMQIPFIGIRREGDKEVLKKEGADYILEDYNDFDLFLDYVEKSSPPRELN